MDIEEVVTIVDKIIGWMIIPMGEAPAWSCRRSRSVWRMSLLLPGFRGSIESCI